MKKVVVAWIFLTFSLQAHAKPTGYWGWASLQRTLSMRLTEPNSYIELEKYLSAGLLELLGGYYGSELKNSAPNSVNLLVWKVVVTGIARDITKLCTGEGHRRFNSSYLEAVSAMCQWPNTAARNERAMNKFWIANMGHDATDAERDAWRNLFLGPYFNNQPAESVIKSMIFAMYMNPHFLLRK